MSGTISLLASMRSNLLSLQQTEILLSLIQPDLAIGNKVNSALNNPVNFFAAQLVMLEAAANDGQYEVAKFILDSDSFKSSYNSPVLANRSYESSSLEKAEEKAKEKGYTDIVSLIQERRTEIAAEIAEQPSIE